MRSAASADHAIQTSEGSRTFTLKPMKTSDFDYELPPEFIAQTPVEPRDHSRLLVLDRERGGTKHAVFRDLPDYLRPGDLLVFNDSRVIPARLYGQRETSGHPIELLLLSRSGPGSWRALVRPGRRMRPGADFVVSDPGRTISVRGQVLEVERSGARIVRFDDEASLSAVGVIPFPPYIHEALPDAERYQTVYSDAEGSVAAPTAGLHFTRQLLDSLGRVGVQKTFVTLHIGWDSFRPVKSENPSTHEMHSEYWELSTEAAQTINRALAERRRVISVGTTAVRLLENAALRNRGQTTKVDPGSGWVDLFIRPGFDFQVVGGLITNFHLPRSTLLMLVSAFAGREQTLDAYRTAVDAGYRFYSFGDAMLIL